MSLLKEYTGFGGENTHPKKDFLEKLLSYADRGRWRYLAMNHDGFPYLKNEPGVLHCRSCRTQ